MHIKGLLLDVEDRYLLEEREWQLNEDRGYAQATLIINGRRTSRAIHLEVMGRNGLLMPWLQVDHINRNKLDNRKHNLRCVTVGRNLSNVNGRARYEEHAHLPPNVYKKRHNYRGEVRKDKVVYRTKTCSTPEEVNKLVIELKTRLGVHDGDVQ